MISPSCKRTYSKKHPHIKARMLDFLFVIFYEILEVLALMLKILVDVVA